MTDCAGQAPIPHRVALHATVRDGYRCRRCGATVLDDANRYLVLAKRNASPELHNVLTLCGRCAERHLGQRPTPHPGGGI